MPVRRYYRDRLSTPRGPCNIWTLRDCWSSGVIDENTLMWGQGLADWVPAKNVNMLIPQIRNFEGARPPRLLPIGTLAGL